MMLSARKMSGYNNAKKVDKYKIGKMVENGVLPPCPRGGQADFSGGYPFKGKRG